jgi:hypothetical protein
MSIFGGAPGINPKAKDLWESVLQSSRLDLNKKQQRRLNRTFDRILSQGADPSAVAFELSTLQSQYPSAETFQPGGDLWQQQLEARLGEEGSGKPDITDANFMAQQIWGRALNPDEEKWIKKSDLSEQDVAGYFYSSPEAYLADFPSAEEQRMAAYYGRMRPVRTPSGGLEWRGYGSSIEPVAYTGGIG